MDDPGPNTATSLILKIVLLLILILINAFFAMSEIAIISLNDAKLEKQAQEGNKKAKKLLKLTSNPSKFLSTIQIGVTLAGFLSSASASQSFVEMLSGALSGIADKINIPPSVVEGFSLVRCRCPEEVRAAALFDAAVKGELAHHQHTAPHVLKAKVHFIVFVCKDPQGKELFTELVTFFFRVVGAHAQKDQEAPSDLPGNSPVHGDGGRAYPGQYRPHQ